METADELLIQRTDNLAERLDNLEKVIQSTQDMVKVLCDDKQMQINAINLRFKVMERNISFLRDSKQDVKGGGGL